MTCIVGMIDHDNSCVYMGGDSAESGGCNIFRRADSKVFRRGNFLIGGTTSFRMLQLLHYKLEIPTIGNKDMMEYMCTDFIDAVRSCFESNGFVPKGDEGNLGGQFLVAHKTRLFRVDEDFQVSETIDDYASVGSGQEFALGAMHIMRNMEDIPVESKVFKALEAAAHLGLGVCEPFSIMCTLNK